MQQQFEELMKQGPPKFEEFEQEDKQEKFKKNDVPQYKYNQNDDLQLNQSKTFQKEDKNEQNKQKLKKDLKKYLSGYKSDLLNQQMNSENSFEEQKSNRKEENQNLLSKKNR
ncbi:hypothetical protein PPERSA_08989 [Pseudocohnilembus persalinus]|uniref:Uncharacterized protein n=1 Tax=Pseudocohnilembus persalinus TaxID=266149 RepID=A0A0V0R3T7_PSEPJ|nr:hypothetical protein PPERSA_08989 [Pseudocohnilembus persalinus]|eukprot:KRX08885.1 hypothetical protein PPERSA_08989 [Pseudocohnilembus persalinus]